MSTYSEYPVFEPNQVLSYTHLNGLVDYLEKQDRLTRRKLIGIGIACGLKVNWKTSEEALHISKGVAVTSEGYLISLEENFYTQFLPYSLPELSMEESGDGEIEDNLYPFLHDENGAEIEMWELLPTTFVPEEGEELPGDLTEGFFEGKVVLLYLETERESMRNCDINDCSDKGARMTFDVRVLAINEADAITILAMEEEIAKLPVHQNKHPKYELTHLDIEKINPARYQLKNFQEIYLRIADILSTLNPPLTAALTDSFDAYSYLLREIYPEADFPSGPFNDITSHFSNVNNDFLQNVISLQYLYDFYCDIVQGYNEFTYHAHQLIAECCPNEERFPKHVLLGKALQSSSAFIPPPLGNAFDPLSAQTGLAPATKPLEYRHYFIPSMIFRGQCELLSTVKSLHYRLYLSAFRYDTEIMKSSDIRLTPSKDGDYFLSDKAIPFYYAFNKGDDFHANWSYDKTVRNRLGRVFSYQFIQSTAHPLLNKIDDHNFYRIEGHVGQGLATVLKFLSAHKKELGLSFAIEPVFIGITGNEEADDQAMRDLMSAAQRLFMCKMRDLDVIFLILIAILFYMLFMLLVMLSRINSGAFFLQNPTAPGASSMANETISSGRRKTDFINQKIVREDSDMVLKKIRKTKGYVKGTVVREITKEPEAPDTGNLYLQINTENSSANLYERTYQVVKRTTENSINPKTATSEVYPTIALIDSTEEVMKSLSTESIAQFDFDLFESRYSTFVDAYSNFNAQEPSPVLAQNEDYRIAKNYTNQNAEKLATSNTQSLLGNLSSELGERFLSMLAELTLPGYAKKHPGLEHKAGVPKGGTFIPIYAHRDFINEELRKLIGGFNNNLVVMNDFVAPGFSNATNGMNLSFSSGSTIGGTNNMTIGNTLVNAAASNDPLDNFIVLGDFCIPTLCCDGDCSDIFDEEVAPLRGTVTGSVRDAATGGVVRQAKVTAVNVSTNTETDTTLDGNGNYRLELEPAGYRISASATGYITHSETKTISGGQNLTLSFDLQQDRSGYRIVPEIANGTAGYEVNSDLGREAMRYYGSRYSYYNAYALKLNADAVTDPDKKVAAQVKSSLDTIMSPETDLTKLNREIKRVNTALVKTLDAVDDDKTKVKVNESIKVINSAYLDKLSLISPEAVTTATKNTLSEIEKINTNSDVRISKAVKEWVEGHNLSSKPKIVEELGKIKIKKGDK